MKQVNYIGLDVHSASSFFVVLDKKGTFKEKCRVETSEKNLLNFIRAQKGIKKLVFEETNLSQWVYLTLYKEVDEIMVCNPYYLGKRKGNKDDFKDALHLANELRCNHLEPVFHIKDEFMKLRKLVSGYNDIVRDLTRMKNRYKAIFRSVGLKTNGITIYKDKERIEELNENVDKFVAKNLYEPLNKLIKIKESYKKEFKKNSKKYTIIKLLSSIPGFDVIRSHIVASLIVSPERFKTKHKFWAYSMLVKYIDKSDGIVYAKRAIYGRRELKNVFYGAAESVIMGNSNLRKYYDKLRSKGLEHRSAKISIARKIASISLFIMKNKIKYDDKFEEKRRKKEKLKNKNKLN